MTVTIMQPAEGGDPLAHHRLEVGEYHAAFCPRPTDCDGVCTEVVEFDGVTVVTTLPAGELQPQFRIATPTGVVDLPSGAASAVALLVLSRGTPGGIPAPGLRRPA